MKDFTLQIYRELLLALKRAGYNFYTFEDWCDGKAQGKYVILRHDVDLRAGHSLATANVEAELNIRASYYFRIVPQSNQPDIISAIAGLKHEVGYHYEDLSLFNGDTAQAFEHFKKQLAHFRQFYPVRTVCMHGSPASKWDNRLIWKEYSYRDCGIVGEPYFDFLTSEHKEKVTYLTDTARMWDGHKYNVRDKAAEVSTVDVHSTNDFIGWLNTKPDNQVIMITTHPQRWTDNQVEWIQELIMQSLKNVIKGLLVKLKTKSK